MERASLKRARIGRPSSSRTSTLPRRSVLGFPANRWIEWILCGLVVAGVVHAGWHLVTQGYLPLPFFYDLNDSMMDGYSTAYYANNPGAYDVWYSVYPPFSFVFLKFITDPSCYRQFDYYYSRDCDWIPRIVIFAIFFLNILLVYLTYRKHDRKTAFTRALAVSIGMPALFGLDRLNLVVPCFTCFVLSTGSLLRSARLRTLALAASINFKPYLLVTIIPSLLKRQWTRFEYYCLWIILIYLLTMFMMGDGTPFQIARDILNFSNAFAKPASIGSAISSFSYSTSFSPILRLLSSDVPLLFFFDSKVVEVVGTLLSTLILAGEVGVALCCLAAVIRPSRVHARRFMALIVAALLSRSDISGGYSLVFLTYLIFFENFKTPFPALLLVFAYLLSIPYDYIFYPITHRYESVYWTGKQVYSDPGATYGDFIRPSLILLIQYIYVGLNLWAILGPQKGRGVADSGPKPFLSAPAISG